MPRSTPLPGSTRRVKAGTVWAASSGGVLPAMSSESSSRVAACSPFDSTGAKGNETLKPWTSWEAEKLASSCVKSPATKERAPSRLSSIEAGP